MRELLLLPVVFVLAGVVRAETDNAPSPVVFEYAAKAAYFEETIMKTVPTLKLQIVLGQESQDVAEDLEDPDLKELTKLRELEDKIASVHMGVLDRVMRSLEEKGEISETVYDKYTKCKKSHTAKEARLVVRATAAAMLMTAPSHSDRAFMAKRCLREIDRHLNVEAQAKEYKPPRTKTGPTPE